MKASGGLDEKEGVTWYRPIPPPGYAVAGDVVRPYLAASPRFYLEAPVFAIGPFPLEAAQRPGAVMVDRKRSAAGLRAKREVLPRQPVNYLAKPVDFEVVWRHEGGVRGMLPCTVWRPVPPPSFVAVGCIITLTHNKPSPDCVVCLHESLVVPAEVDALLWTASASPASAAATNKKGRTLTRAKSERDVTAHTTATFLFGDAEEVYGKSTSDGVVVCSVKPKEGDDEPAIAIGCSLALPVPTATDGLAPPALTGAAYCLRRSVVTHAVHNAEPYPFTSAGASPTAARTIPSTSTTTSTSLPASPVSSLPASPSSSSSMPPSLSSSPSSSSSPALSTNAQRPLPYQASTAEMSPRRLRSASNPPRSPSHSSLASASSAFAASSTAASLRSHRSASHATSPPRSSKRVTHMLDRPSIAGYSITFAPPSPSLPSVKPTSRSSPPSSSSTPARPSYRISSLVPPSPSPSSSSSLPSPSVSMSSSSLLPAWHLPRLSTQATLLPSSSTSLLHSLYPHTSLSSPPSLVAAASDRRYTIGAAGDEYECPRCHGHKGQGPFGPCPLGSIHFTHMCELCEGRGSVAGPSELCRLCEGEGGFGEFGKCRPESLHFRACVKCHGRGFLSARGHSS